MKKVVKRFMVFVLVITLATCNTGTGFSLVKAEEKLETKEKTELGSNVNNEGYCKPEVVEEIVSDRTTDSTTFLLSNGMKQTTYYSDNIYFENEKGQLSEYDNEFVKLDKSDKKQVTDSVEVKGTEKEKYSYVNKEGDSKQFLPSRLSEKTPIVMAKENCIVSFSPADVEDEDSEENILSSETEKVKLDSKSVTSVYDGSREEKKVIAGYEGENKATELSYESLEHGLKETIILKNKPKSNVVSFNMTLQGCYAKVDETGGGITLYSEDDDIVGGMEAPFMDDATENNYSEEIHYELTEINEKEDDVRRYILKLVIDEKYLENATYPVAIDPTVTWNGTTDLPETYVLNSTKVTNYFSSGVKTFSVGKGSQGVFRTYFRAKSLAKTVKDKYIDRATLTVYENGSGVNGSTIYVKPAAASFKCGTVTWKNQPGGTSANLASFKSKGSADAKHEINLKTWAQNVAKGSGDGNKCYGLLFKAGSESSSSYVKFYGARASSHVPKLKVVYYDAPTTASAVTAKCSSDANRSYLKSGESLKVSWAGISAHALSYVQYRITDADGNTLSGHGYSASTKIGTTASGNTTINVGDLKDGTYKVYVRGVDKGGITGTGKSATFHIDKAKPVFTKFVIKESTNTNTYSDSELELTYSVKDDNFYCVQVSVNNGSYKSLSDDKESEDEEISGLVSGQANTIKVRAVDKAGNVSDVKSFTYYYDEDAPVISASINPNTNSGKMDNSEKKPVLKYTISDKTLKSYKVELNGEKINVNGSSGEVELKNVEEGENNISITATDKAGNEEEQELTYYRDTVTPEAGSVKVTPKTGFFNTSNKLPIVYWSGFSDDNLSEIQIKINDGEYKTLGLASSGEGQLQGIDFPKDGKYTLTVRAVDKGGNVSKEVSCNYYYETADYELDDYTPVNVYAVEQIGGNTILRFSTKSGKFRDDVKYQVYRSETPNVVIDNGTLVKSYSSKGMIKVSGEEGKAYYYKIRTVKKTENGNIYSDCSEEISSRTIGLETKDNRLGNNSMFTYSSVSTPNGTGQIELSKGNFLYEQDDISLPAISIPVKITRYYNSKSLNKSSFGYGWNCEYDAYVSECDDKYYYSDGSRAVYTFEKQNTPYMSECVENADMKLETDDDVINKTVEKTTGEKENLEIDVHYKVTNKTGEILRFDDAGRLVLIEEANNNFVYISYNEKDGKIKSVSTDKGQKAVFYYNEEGLINKISVEDNAYGYSYTYSDSYLTKATYIGTDGKTIDYKYAYTDGLLTTITDAEENNYNISYNEKVIRKYINPIGAYTVYDINHDDLTTKVTSYINGCSDGKLGTDAYIFNADGQVVEKKDSLGNISSFSYDNNNKALVTGETDKSSYYALVDGVVTQKTSNTSDAIEYNKDGNIISEKDSSGNITTYDYLDDRNECTKNQPTKVVTKDSSGTITSSIDYTYDEKGNVLIEKDLIENTIATYTYNSDETVFKSKEYLVKDANIVTSNTVEKTEENLESALQIYDGKTEYNEVGDELSENSTEGTVKEDAIYEYDKFGNVIKETDNNSGTVIEYKYDGFFRTIQTKETCKENGKIIKKLTKNVYNKNGSVIQSVDENGRITDSEYDSLNRIVKTILKVGEDSKTLRTVYSYGSTTINRGFAYEQINNAIITTVYNNSNEVISQTYVDSKGRTVKELSSGLYVDYSYDDSGKVFTEYTSGTNQTDPTRIANGKFAVKTYDENGNQTATIINPQITGSTFKVGKDSIVTKNEYDKNGNIIKSTDAEGNQTTYEYDEQGRTKKVTTPSNSSNTYEYDELTTDGDVKVVVDTAIDALGRTSKTTDNGSGQVIKVEDVSSNGSLITTYDYDSNGQQLKETYSDGSYVENTYEDSTGYLIKTTRVNSSGNVESSTQYTYTSDGNIESAIDYKNDNPYRYTYYEYDAYGRNTGVAEINATSTPSTEKIKSSMLKYVYNVDDNIEKIYYPSNAKDKLKGIKFIYNKDKWIIEIDGLLADDATTAIRKYDYFNDAKVKSVKDYQNFLSKGSDYIERDYAYDDFNRVMSMTYFSSSNLDEIKEKYEYDYDKNSNITYKHEISNYENALKDEEIIYIYDADGRLVSSEKNNNLTYKTTRCVYKYDKVGNRTYESELEMDTVATDQSKTTGYYSYNSYNDLDQLTSSTVIECKDGSNVKTSVKTYEYDSKGNQISVINSSDGTSTTYQYDVENQLTDVEIKTNGIVTATQHNEYNSNGQRISKKDTQTDGDKTTSSTTIYYYEGNLLLYTTNEKGNKTSQNIIGNESNVIATIRYNGDAQTEYFYSKDIQGNITSVLDNEGNCKQFYKYTDYGETEKTIENDFYNEIRYTGGVYDEVTGLYYLNARYYNSDMGSFLSQDTYRVGNLYGYCNNNPISYIDPSGHSSVVVSGGVYKQSKKDAGGFYYEFIETALLQLKDWSKLKEKRYWLIADNGWTKKDKKAFKKQAKKYGKVKPIYFESSKQLIKKLNSKKFKKDKINNFTVFAHGYPGKITFGYNYEKGTDDDKLAFKASKIKKISKKSFGSYPTAFFYSCRTASTEGNNKNFAKKWQKHFGGETYAFEGRTDYAQINYKKGYSKLNMKLYEWIYGDDKKFRTAARQYPTGDGIVKYADPVWRPAK